MPDLRRQWLRRMQAERMGGAAAVRAGASERDHQLRARPASVERICFWPGPDAAGHDALCHRRYPPAAKRRSAFPEPVLTMKFSYTWLRELVPGLKMDVTTLAQQITMKTAECEGVHDPGAFPGASV